MNTIEGILLIQKCFSRVKIYKFSEYFTRKKSSGLKDSKSKNLSMSDIQHSTEQSDSIFEEVKQKAKHIANKNSSYERPNLELLINVASSETGMNIETAKNKPAYVSPSFLSIHKSINFPLTSKNYSNMKKHNLLKKYKEKVKKFQNDSFVQNTQVKSNRVLPNALQVDTRSD